MHPHAPTACPARPHPCVSLPPLPAGDYKMPDSLRSGYLRTGSLRPTRSQGMGQLRPLPTVHRVVVASSAADRTEPLHDSLSEVDYEQR